MVILPKDGDTTNETIYGECVEILLSCKQHFWILLTELDLGVDFLTLGSHSKCSFESASVRKPRVQVKLTCQHLTAWLEGGITCTLETSNHAELLFTPPFSQLSASQPSLHSQIFMSVQPLERETTMLSNYFVLR